MAGRLRAAILGTALLAAACAPAAAQDAAAPPAAQAIHASEFDERFFSGPRFEEPPRQPSRAVLAYRAALLVLTAFVAGLIVVCGLDDLFVDACYWLGRLWRRKRTLSPVGPPLAGGPEAPFAIMVPAWKEHDVIAAMIENTMRTLDYRNFRIFCGVYRNDPATACEVDRMVVRYPGRVTRVEVPHNGPTCKADCLNHIVRRILRQEHSSGVRFAGVVLHDSEDVIHPLELKLFNALVPGTDLVQLPVFSLERQCRQLTAGTYMDDFAESHGKDMAVREALVGIVPGAGVATCYSRRAVAALCARENGDPFNTATLTEDYDLSFRLRGLGLSQAFAHVRVRSPEVRAAAVRGRTAGIIATHEYFPDTFKAAYRQRARWVLGIAFQGWQQLGWRGSPLERYFFFRDRKAMVTAPAGALAYLLLLNFVLAMAFGTDDLQRAVRSVLSLPALELLLLANLALMGNRIVQRMVFVSRYYGMRHALLSLVRMPVNNFINFFAVARAWRLFLVHVATGRKLAWDKTAHVFPEAAAAAPVATAPAPVKELAAAMFCVFVALVAPDYAAAAPPPLAGAAYQLADQAYKALERDDLDRALALASQALAQAPGHASLLLLQADILSRQGRHGEALARLQDLPPEELDSAGLAQRAYLWLQAGNPAAAERDFAEALRIGNLSPESRANVTAELESIAERRREEAAAAKPQPESPSYALAEQAYKALEAGDHARAEALFLQALDAGGLSAEGRGNVASELAYLALRRNDDAAALKWLEMALASPRPAGSRAGLYADAGYAATRLARNRVAIEMLSRAVDEWHAAAPGEKPFDEEQLFGMRRSIESLSRRWGIVLSLGHSNQASAPSGLGVPGRDVRVVQAGAEVAYTPERFGYRNERMFQIYANAFQAVYANDGQYATGSASAVGGLGARYKPLEDINLVFALERRFALGAAAGDDDWLLRVGFSASGGTDWHPTRRSWTTWQIYTETVYFTDAGRLVQPFEARLGRSRKAGHGLVLTPFAGIGGEYDEAQDPRSAAGAGPGIAARWWFGETRHRAFPGYLELSLQYRFRMTDARRGGGVFGMLALKF